MTLFDLFRSSMGKIKKMAKNADVDGLMTMLKKHDDPTRKRVMETLTKLGNVAVEPLITLLADKDANLRFRAARALGEIGDNRAVEPLIATLSDDVTYVRDTVVIALGKLKDPRAIKPLAAALNDRVDHVHQRAREALEKIGGPEVEQALSEHALLQARLEENRGVLILDNYWDNDQDGSTYKSCGMCGSKARYSMGMGSSNDHLYRIGQHCPQCGTLFTKEKHIDH